MDRRLEGVRCRRNRSVLKGTRGQNQVRGPGGVEPETVQGRGPAYGGAEEGPGREDSQPMSVGHDHGQLCLRKFSEWVNLGLGDRVWSVRRMKDFSAIDESSSGLFRYSAQLFIELLRFQIFLGSVRLIARFVNNIRVRFQFYFMKSGTICTLK